MEVSANGTALTDYGNGTIKGGSITASMNYTSGELTIKFSGSGECTVIINYNYIIDTKAVLVVENDNNDDSLDFFEKGYLIIELDEGQRAAPRDNVLIEIRPEKSAPLTVSFTVPEAIPSDSYVTLE